MGLGTDGFEILTGNVNRKTVYLTVLLVVQNAEGTNDTLELNVDCSRQQKSKCRT